MNPYQLILIDDDMDILQLLKDKTVQIGDAEACKLLDLPLTILKQFISGKKAPSLKTCQKIVDLWGDIAPVDDGSIAEWTDKDGISNGSYIPAEWGKKKAAWPGRDVCLCLPVYNDVPGAHYFTMLSVVAKYRMALQIQYRGDDSMITRSRNHLAKRFLDTNATWSIWVDSDMVIPFGHSGCYRQLTNMQNLADKFSGLHTIERLISWGKTIVGGCYWDRRGGGKLIAGATQPILSPIPSDNLQPITFNGTGCLAVHRQVFVDIMAKFPETMSPDSLGNESGFFTNIQTPHRMMGEDESFAKRATDAGHPTYLDLGVCCGHVGRGNVHGIPLGGSKI